MTHISYLTNIGTNTREREAIRIKFRLRMLRRAKIDKFYFKRKIDLMHGLLKIQRKYFTFYINIKFKGCLTKPEKNKLESASL